ncbi:MAG TPA: hypothetical protein VFY14_04280 [Streptomyces sp.]|nr:hypothetical protein [Streptomyces sp.]
MTSLLMTLGALVMASTLVAPAAVAVQPADRPAAVPAGWEKIDGTELQALNGGTDGRHSLAAAEDAAADETYILAMQSVRNDNFVTAELNYSSPNTGALRARSTRIGGWENFAFEWDEGTQTFALRSTANNLYVAVEKNYTGSSQNMLRARSTGVGSWERFELYYSEELDRWALRSMVNGLFVAMENNYTGSLQYVLRARSADISGSWEEFHLYDLGV